MSMRINILKRNLRAYAYDPPNEGMFVMRIGKLGTLRSNDVTATRALFGKLFSVIAPAGISPRGEIPRGHPSNSRVY